LHEVRMRVFEEFTKHPREAPRDLRVLQSAEEWEVMKVNARGDVVHISEEV
jgi:hypothetical protein